jgi:hypothetical protein
MVALTLLGVLTWLGLLLVAMAAVALVIWVCRTIGPSPNLPRTGRASVVIANGYLRLDRDEWIRAVEKRRAALGR